MPEVNYLAVLVSAIAAMVIGSIWYGPLFGKRFMREMGMDQWSPEKQAAEKKGMWKSYLLQFIASLVTFAVLGGFITLTDRGTVNGGLMTAFMAWLGFLVPLHLGNTLWGGKWSLFWMGVFHSLIGMLVAGAILGAWR